MKTLQVELSDEMAREVENAVEAGSFANATEVVRVSLREFISRRRFELRQQQLQDVETDTPELEAELLKVADATSISWHPEQFREIADRALQAYRAIK